MDDLDPKRAAPPFTLPTPTGQTRSLATRRGKHPTVLLFFESTTSEAAQRLLPAYQQADFAAVNAEVFVIVAEGQACDGVTVLFDPAGRTAERYIGVPALVVLDRYTAPLLWHTGTDGCPPIEEVIEAIRYSEWSCVI